MRFSEVKKDGKTLYRINKDNEMICTVEDNGTCWGLDNGLFDDAWWEDGDDDVFEEIEIVVKNG